LCYGGKGGRASCAMGAKVGGQVVLRGLFPKRIDHDNNCIV